MMYSPNGLDLDLILGSLSGFISFRNGPGVIACIVDGPKIVLDVCLSKVGKATARITKNYLEIGFREKAICKFHGL